MYVGRLLRKISIRVIILACRESCEHCDKVISIHFDL